MKSTKLQVCILACILACIVILFHHPGRLKAQTLAGQVLKQTSGTPVALVRVTLAGLDGLPVVFTLTDAQCGVIAIWSR